MKFILDFNESYALHIFPLYLELVQYFIVFKGTRKTFFKDRVQILLSEH